ncbi:MAG: MFS transporter [Oscillospiraceae bacterium]|nr:MFS transporter [Oscillospiraceae bacterium]
MAALLIVIIYITFVSLGLPDSLLGSAWPVMRGEMAVPSSYAGFVSMLIAGGTIVASLSSDRLTKRLGAGPAVCLGIAALAAAMFGFSVSSSFWMLCAFALPYGLGAGTVDAALNNYVSLHYAARHMNWLHSCWGLGASISPSIMGFYLTRELGWHSGYRAVAVIQLVLAGALFFTLPMWKKPGGEDGGRSSSPPLKLAEILRIRGVRFVLPAFFSYCAIEMTAILWVPTYLVDVRGVDSAAAAAYAAFFVVGVTAGRFVSGFIAGTLGDYAMIRIGCGVTLLGITAVFLPFESNTVCLYGLIVIGLGCAPIYPAIIHSTPANFGADKSKAIIGVQMASAYTGSTFMPPLFGFLSGWLGLRLLPYFLLLFAVLMMTMIECLRRSVFHRGAPRA